MPVSTYFINLPRRTDRRERIEARLRAAGIEAKFVPGVERDDDPKRGCTLAHRDAVERAILDGCETALIFEDDAVFPPSILSDIEPLLALEWDVCNLGAAHRRAPDSTISLASTKWSVVRVRDAFMAHGYMVRRRVMEELATDLSAEGVVENDAVINDPVRRNVVSVEPPLVVQEDGWSDNLARHTKWDEWFEKTPIVDVVMPIKRKRTLTDRAVAAALGQEGVIVRLILVGDLDGVDGGHLRFDDSGLSAVEARNVGLEFAREGDADYVALLDDDDIWHRRKTALQIEAMEETGASMAQCSLRLVMGLGGSTGRVYTERLSRTRKTVCARTVGKRRMRFAHSVLLARREVYKEIGWKYDERYPIFEDLIWMAHALRAGHEMVVLPDVLLNRYYDSENRLAASTPPEEHAKGMREVWRVLT